jgi:NADPH:quinone reductase-like Zn-dependent oxidoreductase
MAVSALVLFGPHDLRMGHFPRPTIGADDGLLTVEANGICGTDVHFRASAQDTPRILGHEVVGRVAELGDQARQRWGVVVGDRVAVESGVACGTCRDCLAGFSQTRSKPPRPGSPGMSPPDDPRLGWDLPALGHMPREARLDEIVARVLAPNPSAMALDGTNTYVLGGAGSGGGTGRSRPAGCRAPGPGSGRSLHHGRSL